LSLHVGKILKIFDKKTIIGLFIGVIFIALILKNIDIHKSFEAIKHFNFFYMLLMIPVYYCAFLFRALRWRTILLRSGNSEKTGIKFSSFLNSLFRGWLVNYFVPARGGEFYRAHYFGKKEGISRVTVLASIVLERIFDGLLLFLILFLLASFVYTSQKFLGVAVIAGFIFIGTFSGLLLTSKFYKNIFIQKKYLELLQKINVFLSPPPCPPPQGGGKPIGEGAAPPPLSSQIKKKLSKIFNKITSAVISFMNGLEIFNSPVLILKTFLFTIPVWLCEGLSLLLLIKGFGYSVGILTALFILSIVAFISLIPGGPAGLGPVQWGYIIALGFFNIPRETAFALSLVGQPFSIILISLGCLFFITTERLNLKKDYINLEN